MSQFAFERGDRVRYTGDDEAAAPVGDGIDGLIADFGTRSETQREQHTDTVRDPMRDTKEEMAYIDVVTDVITETIVTPVYVLTFPDRMDPVTVVGDDDARRVMTKLDTDNTSAGK